MPRAQLIKITKDGLEGQCLKESLKAYQRNGWTVADDGSSEEAVEVTDTPVETEASPEAKKTTTRKAP